MFQKYIVYFGLLDFVCLMVFNNISVISWRSVLLLVEEIGGSGENHWSAVHLAWVGFKLTTLVVIGTDCNFYYRNNIKKLWITRTMYTSISTLSIFSKKTWEMFWYIVNSLNSVVVKTIPLRKVVRSTYPEVKLISSLPWDCDWLLVINMSIMLWQTMGSWRPNECIHIRDVFPLIAFGMKYRNHYIQKEHGINNTT